MAMAHFHCDYQSQYSPQNFTVSAEMELTIYDSTALLHTLTDAHALTSNHQRASTLRLHSHNVTPGHRGCGILRHHTHSPTALKNGSVL